MLDYYPQFHALSEVPSYPQEFWIELAVNALVKAENFSQAASYMIGILFYIC